MKRNVRKLKNHETGITLVALVVTIVVLLILAGITIIYVFGENGIFKLAQDAKDQTEQAKKDEQEYFNNVNNTINKYLDGNGGGSTTPDKTEYTDSNGDKAPIPGGFYVVGDSKENPEDKNTVRNGLVISDVKDDDLDNSKHGNQFVWISVEDYSKFHLKEGYYEGSLDTMLSVASNPSREAGDTVNVGSPGKPNATNSVGGTAESIAMYKSVKENKGFYIARFEAGISGITANSTLSTKTATDGSVKPLSQKGVGVWNSIQWGGTTLDIASDNLPGNDNADGAVKVARSMYKNDGTHKVTSTLCYGVQWDATLKFIEPNYGEYNEEKTEYEVVDDSYVKNSTGKGHYSTSSVTTTGSNIAYQQKHIYDMAGNIYEWTMEAYDIDGRVRRGGRYNQSGSKYSASYRNRSYPSHDVDGGTGFRIALYL